jgi:hypothetical protein
MLPFLQFILATFLAFIIGAFTNGFLPAAYEWASWLEPLSFGVFLIIDERGFEENRAALMGALRLGLITVGGYGIYQFFNLPAWDAAWLRDSHLTAAGLAYAEEVRVWSTLNDYGSFAFVLVASLIFMMVTRGKIRIAAVALGIPALLLSQDRTAWGVFAIAAFLMVWRMGGKERIRIVLLAVIVLAVATPILTIEPVANLISERFSSISNLEQDQSAQSRENLYENSIVEAFSQPFGQGFGALGLASKLTTGQSVSFDSGLLQFPLTFGWVGGLVIGWSILTIIVRLLATFLKSADKIITASCAMSLGSMAALVFGQIFVGPLGMVMWMSIGVALSSHEPQRSKDFTF